MLNHQNSYSLNLKNLGAKMSAIAAVEYIEKLINDECIFTIDELIPELRNIKKELQKP